MATATRNRFGVRDDRLHGNEWTMRLPDDEAKYWGAAYITIKAELHHYASNARPHFSITATIHKGDTYPCSDRLWVAGGCLHGSILKARPDLAPLVALHLSDDTGAPMHAEANGWYWLAGALGGMGERYHGGNAKIQHWKDSPTDREFDGYRESTPDECLRIFADHCRMSMEEARTVAEFVKGAKSPRECWRLHCASMGERWAREALAGIELLKTL